MRKIKRKKTPVKKNFIIPIIIIAVLSIVLCIWLGLNLKESDDIVHYSYEIINTYPHDSGAFTQGLVYENGFLYEGTGLEGRSSLRKVELETGNVIQNYELPGQFFGEGITIFDDKIIQLTYTSKVGFVYDKETFEQVNQFNYTTQGWGLTHNGRDLIMSDGTPVLYFFDPVTFEQKRTQTVRDERGSLLWNINELEYINGSIYANIWQRDKIAIISPQDGRVTGWIDLAGLLPSQDYGGPECVLNGIAYDPDNKRLFVTGKFWPKLFEIKLIRTK